MAQNLTGSVYISRKADGTPNALGFVYTYAAGTLTNQASYTTQAAGTANTNPVELAADGTAAIWLDPTLSYRIIEKTAAGVTIRDVDNISGTPTAADLASTASVGLGDALVGVKSTLTGAVGTTLHAWLESMPAQAVGFGAAGDGSADDTAELQALLSSGATRVTLKPGATYIVSHTSTVTVNGTAQRYCLLIPAGVVLDMNGATIKAAAASNSSPVMLYSVADSGICNGVIDCNKANQTTPATGEIAAVFAYGCTRPYIHRIKAINCRQYAGRFLGNAGGSYTNLWCTDSDADGWSFGVDGGYSGHITDALIDNIYAEACTQVYGGGYQGNPAIFCVKRCAVGTVIGKHSAGGLKIQDSTEDAAFGSLVFYGPTNGSVNSGVKVQGNSGSAIYPTRVSIANVVVEGAYGNGLRVTDVDSVQIGSYTGRTNGAGAAATGSDQYDVYIDTSNGTGTKCVQIGAIHSHTPKTVGVNALGTGRVILGSAVVKDATGAAVLVSMTAGIFDCGKLLAADDAGTLTYALRVTGAVGGFVREVETTATHSTSQSRVTVAAANYKFSVGSIRLGSTDVLEGAAQLTNGATSTSVTCGHIWKDYVGGTADTFQPIIQIIPMEATAAALAATMYCVPVAGSSGTGFAIKHSSAGAANYVSWKVLGWKTLSRDTG